MWLPPSSSSFSLSARGMFSCFLLSRARSLLLSHLLRSGPSSHVLPLSCAPGLTGNASESTSKGQVLRHPLCASEGTTCLLLKASALAVPSAWNAAPWVSAWATSTRPPWLSIQNCRASPKSNRQNKQKQKLQPAPQPILPAALLISALITAAFLFLWSFLHSRGQDIFPFRSLDPQVPDPP